MPAVSANSVSFASAMASSERITRNTLSTGPKISVRASIASGDTSAKIVGGTKYPSFTLSGTRPSKASRASCLPASMTPRMRRCASASITGPTIVFGFGGITDHEVGGGLDQPVQEAIVIFAQHDQPRERRAFLALETEGRVERGGHRLVLIGVVIDDEGVLAAHFADDFFQVGLAGPRLAGRLPDAQADLLRSGEGDEINLRVIDQVRRRPPRRGRLAG